MLRKFILATALFALSFATAANAASRVWISEFAVLTAPQAAGHPGRWPHCPAGPAIDLDLSGGTAQTVSSVRGKYQIHSRRL
jgi:hypothetical protein